MLNLMLSCRGGVLPYMVYIGYGFSAVLVINRISILAIVISNRVWLFHSSFELGMSFRGSYFSSLSTKPSSKALHKLCLGQLCQPQRS